MMDCFSFRVCCPCFSVVFGCAWWCNHASLDVHSVVVIWCRFFFLQVRHRIRLSAPQSSAGTICHPRFFHLHWRSSEAVFKVLSAIICPGEFWGKTPKSDCHLVIGWIGEWTLTYDLKLFCMCESGDGKGEQGQQEVGRLYLHCGRTEVCPTQPQRLLLNIQWWKNTTSYAN